MTDLEDRALQAIGSNRELQAMVSEMFDDGKLVMFSVTVHLIDFKDDPESAAKLSLLLGPGNEC